MLDHLLQKTSRTFALTIPMLREPTRTEVGVAYLLFRVADTLEDATRWPRDRKVVELERLARLIETIEGPGAPEGPSTDPTMRPMTLAVPSAAASSSGTTTTMGTATSATAVGLAAGWIAEPPLDHEGYRELLASFPEVLDAARALSPAARRLVAHHTARTCRGMASFVAREGDGGGLRLRDVADLRAYCYAVAGIVGEMLTELFLLDSENLRAIAPDLRREAAAFGEALQLVNILKDAAADSVEGRTYLPPGVVRGEVFALARADLAKAARYCGRLEGAGADGSLVAFTALPVLLAKATLDRVEADGPGAKIGRALVGAIVSELQEAVAGRKVEDLLGRVVTAGPR